MTQRQASYLGLRARWIAILCLSLGLSKAAAVRAAPSSDAVASSILDRYLGLAPDGRGDEGAPRKFEIDASLPRMHKQGIMRGLKLITVAGRVAFTQLHFVGDELIKTAVIGRFLAAEAKERRAGEDLGITPLNYRFHYMGSSEYNGRMVFIFRTTPTRRQVGLFRGEVWLDAETARPLREWGQFVKSPSVLLSDIYFVRDYVSEGVNSRPRRIILKLQTAFAGPAELTMWLDEP